MNTSSTPLGRRQMIRQAAAAALAGTGLLLASGPQAHAGRRRAAGLLPAIGQTFTMDMKAFGTSLVVPLPPPLPRLDFRGRISVKVLAGGADFVHLQTLDFTMVAVHPLLGEVRLQLPAINVSPASTLQEGVGGLVETWLQAMDMTFERFGDLPGPFTLETTQPAKASGTLPQFPPPSTGENPDGSPTGGAFLTAAGPIRFTGGSSADSPIDLSAVQLQWDGVYQGQPV
ncbi:hypothetical protein ACF059_11810 [Streptomyces sp. NPDC016562]|uniref:hypothetical protein n=1 Tax=Streptomyces sp. NPDC016562 TaxID=3364966 RepID=UPI0036F897FA